MFDFSDNLPLSVLKIGAKGPRRTYAEQNWEAQIERFRDWLHEVKVRSEKRNEADSREAEAEAEREQQWSLAYDGDAYFKDLGMKMFGMSAEEAEADAQDRFLVCARLEFDGLEQILQDRYARPALAEALREGDKGVLLRLSRYTQQATPESRRLKARDLYKTVHPHCQAARDQAQWYAERECFDLWIKRVIENERDLQGAPSAPSELYSMLRKNLAPDDLRELVEKFYSLDRGEPLRPKRIASIIVHFMTGVPFGEIEPAVAHQKTSSQTE